MLQAAELLDVANELTPPETPLGSPRERVTVLSASTLHGVRSKVRTWKLNRSTATRHDTLHDAMRSLYLLATGGPGADDEETIVEHLVQLAAVDEPLVCGVLPQLCAIVLRRDPVLARLEAFLVAQSTCSHSFAMECSWTLLAEVAPTEDAAIAERAEALLAKVERSAKAPHDGHAEAGTPGLRRTLSVPLSRRRADRPRTPVDSPSRMPSQDLGSVSAGGGGDGADGGEAGGSGGSGGGGSSSVPTLRPPAAAAPAPAPPVPATKPLTMRKSSRPPGAPAHRRTASVNERPASAAPQPLTELMLLKQLAAVAAGLRGVPRQHRARALTLALAQLSADLEAQQTDCLWHATPLHPLAASGAAAAPAAMRGSGPLSVVRICADDAQPFSTKERVPYMVCLELAAPDAERVIGRPRARSQHHLQSLLAEARLQHDGGGGAHGHGGGGGGLWGSSAAAAAASARLVDRVGGALRRQLADAGDRRKLLGSHGHGSTGALQALAGTEPLSPAPLPSPAACAVLAASPPRTPGSHNASTAGREPAAASVSFAGDAGASAGSAAAAPRTPPRPSRRPPSAVPARARRSVVDVSGGDSDTEGDVDASERIAISRLADSNVILPILPRAEGVGGDSDDDGGDPQRSGGAPRGGGRPIGGAVRGAAPVASGAGGEARGAWRAGAATGGGSSAAQGVSRGASGGDGAGSPSGPAAAAAGAAGGVGRAFGEAFSERQRRLAARSPHASLPRWHVQLLVVKANDELRQERFAMQLIQAFDAIFARARLPLALRPYRIVTAGPDCGVIEGVADAISIDSLKQRTPDCPNLGAFFQRHFHADGARRRAPAEGYHRARLNFARSAAAYSIVCYLLQLKDRHNGNILLTTDGCGRARPSRARDGRPQAERGPLRGRLSGG